MEWVMTFRFFFLVKLKDLRHIISFFLVFLYLFLNDWGKLFHIGWYQAAQNHKYIEADD